MIKSIRCKTARTLLIKDYANSLTNTTYAVTHDDKFLDIYIQFISRKNYFSVMANHFSIPLPILVMMTLFSISRFVHLQVIGYIKK